jgi:hypothetical protein
MDLDVDLNLDVDSFVRGEPSRNIIYRIPLCLYMHTPSPRPGPSRSLGPGTFEFRDKN